MKLREIRLRLLLLGATVLLVGGLVEIGARTWLHRLASEEQFHAYASIPELVARGSYGRFVRHRYTGYIPTPGYRKGANFHNALGYRGEGFPADKPPGEFRIVALGGSTTYTNQVEDHRHSYPAQLQQELRERGHRDVRVINAGVPGFTSWDSLANLQFRVLDLDPDLILVYHAVNDIFSRMIWPPEAYRGDNSGYLGPADPSGAAAPWFERSAAVRIFRIRLGLAASPGALERNFVVARKTSHGWRYLRQVMEGSYPSGVFRRASAQRMLRRSPPRYFRRNMEAIVALARARGVEPVLVSFAYSEEKPDAPLATEPFRLGMDQHNQVTAAIARRLDVPFFDFAAVFPKTLDLWNDGVHVNTEGAALKARYFADFLVSSGLLP